MFSFIADKKFLIEISCMENFSPNIWIDVIKNKLKM